MDARLALITVTLAACGGGAGDGEPMSGTLAIGVGGETITPAFGAAIEESLDQDPGGTRAVVVMGTAPVSCETNVTGQLSQGTYVTFRIDRATGAQTSFATVIRVVEIGAFLNGAPSPVMIDALDGRITGSVTLAATDDRLGAITAAGTFDVIRCF